MHIIDNIHFIIGCGINNLICGEHYGTSYDIEGTEICPERNNIVGVVFGCAGTVLSGIEPDLLL